MSENLTAEMSTTNVKVNLPTITVERLKLLAIELGISPTTLIQHAITLTSQIYAYDEAGFDIIFEKGDGWTSNVQKLMLPYKKKKTT